MPPALQVLDFYKQSLTGGAFEALSAASGDSLTFYNYPQSAPAFIAGVWAVDSVNVCEISITASRFHDQTYGMRFAIPDGDLVAPTTRPSLISPPGFDQPIYPSDVMTVQANGTAADNVNVTMLVYYSDLPGIDGRYVTSDTVRARLKNLVGVKVAPTSGAGTWGTAVALNSTTDLLHANTDYAVLGWTSTTPCAGVYIQGIDTGNMRVGGPSLASPQDDAYFFANLADKYRMPLIPVINSNNAGAINVAAAHTASAAKVIDILLAELRP